MSITSVGDKQVSVLHDLVTSTNIIFADRPSAIIFVDLEPEFGGGSGMDVVELIGAAKEYFNGG
jgi:hypothetical protein